MKYLILLILSFCPLLASATLPNTGRIGGLALDGSALLADLLKKPTLLKSTSFRALPLNPASAAITVGGGLVMMAIGDGINELKVQVGTGAPLSIGGVKGDCDGFPADMSLGFN